MTDEINTADGPMPTVAAQDIARLADVGRAAVSNWRRRFPDFPDPVGGSSASPLYSLADVERWLTRHGRAFNLKPADQIWQRIRGATSDLRLGDLVSYLGAFLVFLERDPERWRALYPQPDGAIADELNAAIAREIPELSGGLGESLDPEWVGVLRVVSDVVGEQGGHAGLFESVFDRYIQMQSRRHWSVTPPHMAELMVDLADVPGRTVLDPACGVGTVLLTAHASGADATYGQELDDVAARLAALRLLLHNVRSNVVAADSLRADAFGNERFDVVVCNPPFSERSWGYDELTSDPRWEHGLPPRGESELAWVQHCLAHIKPGGRAVITMPPGAASRRAGRRIRANLLRTGTLQAVISLSSSTAGPTPTDIWVLQRPTTDAAPANVLMVDTPPDATIAVTAWRQFLDNPALEPIGPARSVRIIDLLDDEVDISPMRHVGGAERSSAGDFERVRAELEISVQALSASLAEVAAPSGVPPASTTSIGEFVKAGVIAVQQASTTMPVADGEISMLTAEDVRLGRPPSDRAAASDGLVMIAPGDVVVSSESKDINVRVFTYGGVALGPRLLLLRADPERLDPYFLAAFIQVAHLHALARGSSSLAGRTDVRRTSLPRLSIAEQRAYGERFQQLLGVADALRTTASLGDSLVRLGFAGLSESGLPATPR